MKAWRLQAGVTCARFSTSFLHDDDFHFDVLQRDLVVDQIQEAEGTLIRHLLAAKLDPGWFAGQLGMRRDHLAIKKK